MLGTLLVFWFYHGKFYSLKLFILNLISKVPSLSSNITSVSELFFSRVNDKKGVFPSIL
jgi:hypothetical protein